MIEEKKESNNKNAFRWERVTLIILKLVRNTVGNL